MNGISWSVDAILRMLAPVPEGLDIKAPKFLLSNTEWQCRIQ